uniref:MAPKKK14 n=1 Tax=Solanum tuberosum TaxID=4113 RepID=M1DNF7_SOLTU
MLKRSQSLRNEREFLGVFEDYPQIIRFLDFMSVDFGLSITFEQNWKEKVGHRGTRRYMAPKVLLKKEYGPGVDIWSLECIVYEIITGKPLWESSNSEPNFENPKLSTEAKDFLNNCLVKNPSARWSADML